MQVFTVKTLSLQVLRVELPTGSSVGQLKVALCTPPRDGWWDPDSVKLCCNGSTLKDEESLASVAEYLSDSADRFISALVKPDKKKPKIDAAKIDRLAAEARALNPAAAAMADTMQGMSADMLGPSALAAAMQAVSVGACSMSAGASAAVAAADVDFQAKRKVVAFVSCASVSMKLTLGDRLLGKSLLAALIEPFLSAYNKKVGDQTAALTFDGVLCVEVDGVEVDVHELAGEVMQSDSVRVLLRTVLSW